MEVFIHPAVQRSDQGILHPWEEFYKDEKQLPPINLPGQRRISSSPTKYDGARAVPSNTAILHTSLQTNPTWRRPLAHVVLTPQDFAKRPFLGKPQNFLALQSFLANHRVEKGVAD